MSRESMRSRLGVKRISLEITEEANNRLHREQRERSAAAQLGVVPLGKIVDELIMTHIPPLRGGIATVRPVRGKKPNASKPGKASAA